MAKLLDPHGRPFTSTALKADLMEATLGSVRSPMSGYSADGLDPERLARILREADAGDPVRYLELAETIEERDPHYVGVLGTRRRSVSQIDITVDAGGDTPDDMRRAEMVRTWLKRDELQGDLFDILDCIGKGYSGTEIIWDASMGQWMPQRLEWRDPRWFRFSDHDLKTPMRLDESGQKIPLEPSKFIWAQIQAKSGLPLRGGLARCTAWAWMFKAFTQRDWAIFTQTYGQPVRVGKWGENATEENKQILFRAVSKLAGDMAAIIPESMNIEFIESGNVGAASGNYKERSDWLDQQVSKAVLGQTATTDAVTGGLGSGKEHRQVQEDIERADARALAAILNRDLIRPWMRLNFGDLKSYPRLKIERAEQEDLKAFADAVAPLIDRGLQVSQAEVMRRFNLPAAKAGEAILTPRAPSQGRDLEQQGDDEGSNSIIKRKSGVFKRGRDDLGASSHAAALMASEGAVSQDTPAADPAADPASLLADRLSAEAAPAMRTMLEQLEAMMKAAGSLEELSEMLRTAHPDLDASALAQVIAQAMLAGHLGGRVAAQDE